MITLVVRKLPVANPAETAATARALLHAARAQAQQQTAAADQHCRSVFESAHAAGLLQGRIDSIVGLLALQSLKSRIVAAVHDNLVDLIMLVCSEVLQREICADDTGLGRRLRLALGELPGVSRLELQVNSRDTETISNSTASIAERIECRLVVDDTVAPGSLRLVTDCGTVIADPWEHFQAIELFLREPQSSFRSFVQVLVDGQLPALLEAAV